jgi:2-phospho-L-lactate guanylyltransferase
VHVCKLNVKAIIPFKKGGAKSRLWTFFNEKEREELALRMLKDVLSSLSGSQIEEVEILTTCSENELMGDLTSWELFSHAQLKMSVREDKRGLNEALNDVIKNEKTPQLIIMADIPLTTSECINELLAHEEDVVIAPGRKGGTNALILRKPCECFVSYYGLSCLEHIEMAKRKNLSYAVHDSFFISVDIDEIDDLMELLIHGRGLAAEYLRTIGVSLLVDKKSKMRAKVGRK